MRSQELPPIDEFDLITAGIEIDYVTEELGVMELIIRDYPKLTKQFNETKKSILVDPTSFLIHSLETQIMTERELPALAKIIYGI
jgi:hypothetical protein